jgi:protein-S-isoprenylcysteine O-methyltransferase Ste14
MMLWIRGLIFTLLIPAPIAFFVPSVISSHRAGPPAALFGWALFACGAAVYTACLLHFLLAKGTPALFLTRSVRAVIGEEPRTLIFAGVYRRSRNPMYVGVVLAILGQALMRGSWLIAGYGALVWLSFHLIVVFFEEPHLRARDGAAYQQYCRATPRWLGRSGSRRLRPPDGPSR